jgi:ribosomal protein S18 acetylase RimI-like enzyme
VPCATSALRGLLEAPTAFGSTHAREAAFEDATWIERARGGATDRDRATFVVEREGTIVGLATGLAGDPAADEATLVGMYVAPEVRGRGVGDALVEAVTGWAVGRDLARLRLWVTETNAPAIALYRRHGFQDDGGRQPLDHTPSLAEWRLTRALISRAP